MRIIIILITLISLNKCFASEEREDGEWSRPKLSTNNLIEPWPSNYITKSKTAQHKAPAYYIYPAPLYWTYLMREFTDELRPAEMAIINQLQIIIGAKDVILKSPIDGLKINRKDDIIGTWKNDQLAAVKLLPLDQAPGTILFFSFHPLKNLAIFRGVHNNRLPVFIKEGQPIYF